MKTQEPGYVYILTNPSFREDWVKIGMTQNLEERLKTLDTTALPLPFKPFATLKTVKYQVAEKHVHHYIEHFTNLRIRDNREFFNIKPQEALKILREVAELLDDAEIIVYDETEKTASTPPSMAKRTSGHLFNHEYWDNFVEFMKMHPSDLFHTPNAGYDHWINIAIGKGGIVVALLLDKRKQRATIQLWIANDAEKQIFDALYVYAEQAEASIGHPLNWRRMDGKKASSVELYLNDCGITDKSCWGKIFVWYREYTEKYIAFFKPKIMKL